MPEVVPLPIEAIRLDGGTQPRAIISRDIFEEYAEALANGATFPPVVVYFDGSDYWLADGFHRLHAHQTLGLAVVDADVRQGGRRDAVLHSVGANADHGLRRSNDDKRRAVVALLNDTEWTKWSDREIGRQCRVSPPLVATERAKLPSVSSYSQAERTFLRGSTEATMQVAAIGRRPAKPLPLVAGRVPDHRPQPEFATNGEIGMGTASAVTGLAAPRLAKIARTGEIEGARKDGSSWVFEAAPLKAWMGATLPEPPATAAPDPEPPFYDPGAHRPMLDMIYRLEELVGEVSPSDLLAWLATNTGLSFDPAVINRARTWIDQFAEGYPAAEQARQALRTRITEEA